MPIGFWAIGRKELKLKLETHMFEKHPAILEMMVTKLALEAEDALCQALDETVAFFIVRERL